MHNSVQLRAGSSGSLWDVSKMREREREDFDDPLDPVQERFSFGQIYIYPSPHEGQKGHHERAVAAIDAYDQRIGNV